MVVNYVTEATSSTASVRYRFLIPASHADFDAYRGNYPMLEADVYVFGKPLGNDVEWARQCVRHGKPIVWDVSDNHFREKAEPELKEKYYEMLDLADYITCPTRNMAEVIREHGKEATVIPDPWAYDEKEPKEFEGEPSVLMFGNIASMNSMRTTVDKLAKHGYTNKLCLIGDTRYKWKGAEINQWSHSVMQAGFDGTDIVIIPVESADRSHTKSPNRMVDSIRQGKFVIAEPMPEYEQFSEWMYVGNVIEGMEWISQHKSELTERIRKAQAYVRASFDPVDIGRKWGRLFSSILERDTLINRVL